MIRALVILLALTATIQGATPEMWMMARRARMGKVSEWSPADVSGIQFWYDASHAASLQLSGSSVTGWVSRVGDYRMRSGAAPTVTNSAVNGLNAINFSASKWMTNTTRNAFMNGKSNFVFIAVAKTPASMPAGDANAFASSGRTGDGIRWSLGLGTYASQNLGWAGVNSGTGLYKNNANTSSTVYLLSFVKTPTVWNIYTNGVIATSNISDTSKPGGDFWLTFGGEGNGSYPANVILCEFIVLCENTNTSDRVLLENYVKTKWGQP